MRDEIKNVIRESASKSVTSVVKDSQIQSLTLRLDKAEKKLAILRTPPSAQKLPLSTLHHSSVKDLQSSEHHLSGDDFEVTSTTAASDMAHSQIQMQPLSLRNSFASAKVADKNSAGTNKGEGLASVLINMSRDKQLQNPIVNSTIPPPSRL